jgi:hypothetical protein
MGKRRIHTHVFLSFSSHGCYVQTLDSNEINPTYLMLVLKLERLKTTSKKFMKPTIDVATNLKGQDVITIA